MPGRAMVQDRLIVLTQTEARSPTRIRFVSDGTWRRSRLLKNAESTQGISEGIVSRIADLSKRISFEVVVEEQR